MSGFLKTPHGRRFKRHYYFKWILKQAAVSKCVHFALPNIVMHLLMFVSYQKYFHVGGNSCGGRVC